MLAAQPVRWEAFGRHAAGRRWACGRSTGATGELFHLNGCAMGIATRRSAVGLRLQPRCGWVIWGDPPCGPLTVCPSCSSAHCT